MPTKGTAPPPDPGTSTAHGPQPSRSSSSMKRSTSASLSSRVGDEPSDSTTRGWVFSAKKGDRSTSVNGRRTSRGVVTIVVVGPVSGPAARPAYAPAASLTAVSAAQR